MTREEIIDELELYTVGRLKKERVYITVEELQKYIDEIKALEQEPCEMTAEEYRQRMIQAFHNADTDELIAICVLPTEKEFEHLEWLLKNHYKQEPKTGHWIEDAKTYYEELKKRGLGVDEYTPYFTDDIACSECLAKYSMLDNETQFFKHCPNCGARMIEPQERSDKE